MSHRKQTKKASKNPSGALTNLYQYIYNEQKSYKNQFKLLNKNLISALDQINATQITDLLDFCKITKLEAHFGNTEQDKSTFNFKRIRI